MRSADGRWMRVCLAAARRGRGRVSPNPLVGAAVVRHGRLIAVGYHARFGGEHAETAAIRKAGRRARGSTLYVTLEPCAHHGKTPPCARAIAAAGVAVVVAAMRDPHPLVNGRGFRTLRRAGVALRIGSLTAEARLLNEAYLTALATGRPLVTLKAGMTLDGKIATVSRESRWITSPASRREAHRLRSRHDAILVGSGTALRDAPRLTARTPTASRRCPMRIVLDSTLRLDPRAPMLSAARGGPVIVYAARDSRPRRLRLERAGATVVIAGRGRGGVHLGRVLEDLVRRGVQSLLVEGGSEVAWSFLASGAVDRVAFFVAPRIIGGTRSVSVVGGAGVARLDRAFAVRDLAVRRVGPDLLLTGRVQGR
jgi:diaminohydroxyphosphoribosylaminopyrimidine deaminase / 5-amino-6-(5-phosphoribosylamino)uracil reductase